jgi:hypothetical protein
MKAKATSPEFLMQEEIMAIVDLFEKEASFDSVVTQALLISISSSLIESTLSRNRWVKLSN